MLTKRFLENERFLMKYIFLKNKIYAFLESWFEHCERGYCWTSSIAETDVLQFQNMSKVLGWEEWFRFRSGASSENMDMIRQFRGRYPV